MVREKCELCSFSMLLLKGRNLLQNLPRTYLSSTQFDEVFFQRVQHPSAKSGRLEATFQVEAISSCLINRGFT
jgi:hypothetical protein